MIIKPALSLQDQVDTLISRGMFIPNRQAAERFLAGHNYYHLNAYFHSFFAKQDEFIAGTCFEDVTRAFNNDCWLRKQTFSLIEPIEIHIRTKLAYTLAVKYGPEVLYMHSVYDDVPLWEQNLNTILREISRNKENPVVQHHVRKYSGVFPIWVAVEFMSLGTLSKFFSNLASSDRRLLANEEFGIPDEYLKSWLKSLTLLRNVCAHSGFLFRRSLTSPPRVFPGTDWSVRGGNHTLFAFLYVARRLSTNRDWRYFYQALVSKEKRRTFLTEIDYGFPKDWQTYLK